MAKTAQAVIIGGGIIGCSIAYYLAKKGVKPLLIERRGIGDGTSGACDGFIFIQTKKPGLQLDMAMASADMYTGLNYDLGSEVYYERPGGLILIDSEPMLKIMESVVKKQKEQGMDVELISGAQARKIEPCLSENIIAASYSRWDGLVNPIYTTLAYAKAARRLGAEILTHCPVTGFRLKGGRLTGVSTALGDIETDVVVLSAGVWSPEIGAMLELDIPIRPRRGHILVTEPLAPMFKTVMLDARYIAVKHNPELAESSNDEFMRLGVGMGVEQTEHGNILVGNSRDFAGMNTNTERDVTQAIARYASRFIPFLKNVNIIRTFAGLRPYTADGAPILGPVSEAPGLFIAAGHEGDGIALAPITGAIAADMLTGYTPVFDVSGFSFNRFGKAGINGEGGIDGNAAYRKPSYS